MTQDQFFGKIYNAKLIFLLFIYLLISAFLIYASFDIFNNNEVKYLPYRAYMYIGVPVCIIAIPKLISDSVVRPFMRSITFKGAFARVSGNNIDFISYSKSISIEEIEMIVAVRRRPKWRIYFVTELSIRTKSGDFVVNLFLLKGMAITFAKNICDKINREFKSEGFTEF